MSDYPRPEQRHAVADAQRERSVIPTQVLERISQGLSPCDDDLPFAQAVRAKDEMQKAVRSFALRQKVRDSKTEAAE